jgi:DNA replication protein DnaC
LWVRDLEALSKKQEEGKMIEPNEFMQKCKCRLDKEMSAKLENANIPEEFQGVTIQSFDLNLYHTQKAKKDAEKAKRAAGNFVKNFRLMQKQGKGLYLYSKTKGSGKTRLAASIVNALVKVYDSPEEPLKILFISTVDLLNEIKKTFGDDSKVKTSSLIDTVKTVDVLVLDDIGVENVKPWIEELFTGILDYRLTNKEVTIFTSNSTIEGLDAKYREGRVSSRIEKMAFPVLMPDESIRRELAKQENEELQNLLYQ